ncbi:hypothetical protein J4214_02035 [Candidatus Woesearchaeota archaeon]|nr:hypothetical protein [Candidatus Woesearchaeota archaeon]
MKKADLSLQTIAVAILVLVVLVVLVIAFRSQIASLFDSFSQIISGTKESASDISFKNALVK